MKILIINCSPVRTGATDGIVRAVGEAVSSGNEVRCTCIDDYAIHYCTGCRTCHTTAECCQQDDVNKLMEQYAWADRIVSVSPSYWADVPGQFKVFIDRCTPWCDTHEPHKQIPAGKKGYTIALRTGPGMRECERIFTTIEHFYGHLHIAPAGRLGLCGVECLADVAPRTDEIRTFCQMVLE